jgi:cell division inhibitor SulA
MIALFACLQKLGLIKRFSPRVEPGTFRPFQPGIYGKRPVHSIHPTRWPSGIQEMACTGEAELKPLMPTLALMTRQRKWVVLIAPPYAISDQMLNQAGVMRSRYMVIQARSPEARLWAAEQALRSEHCGMVLVWGQGFEADGLRRLQRIAEECESSGIYFNTRCNTLNALKKAA